ncbi:MAG: ABC transporter ATP-binding protein [Alphaproteobacteria bacterium]|nr:ABC transporter ATP-binding protein [Alphaproteobacteria bacterium]
MTAMIEIDGLVKHFGPIRAVDGVSFQVARGEVLGFLGPNGAGKSTTMKMATGFLTPTAGMARICGFDVEERPIEAKARLGYLPEGAPLYPDMNAGAFLDFIADIRGLSGDKRRARLDHAVRSANLADVLGQPIDTLSKGFKRRVGLAQAILHDPEVLILDEPTDGLDPNQKHEVRALIASMAKDKAIVISTHILEEVQAICSRCIIIARGKVVADGTPAQLEARSRWHNAVAVTIAPDKVGAVVARLTSLAPVATVETVDLGNAGSGHAKVVAFPKQGQTIIGTVSDALRGASLPVVEIRVETGRLDEVFRTVTLAA